VTRNRQQVPREQRVTELLAAATEVMLTNGYARTRMADIARAAGVANAALYWYFPSKEHVLAAVFQRALSDEATVLAARMRGPDPLERLLRGLADLRPYRHLHMAMHQHLETPAVMEVHDELIDWIRGLARDALTHRGYEGAALDDLCEVIVTLVEGLNVPHVQVRHAGELIQTLLAALAPP
jgi:AcrR family transcriptional regulator